MLFAIYFRGIDLQCSLEASNSIQDLCFVHPQCVCGRAGPVSLGLRRTTGDSESCRPEAASRETIAVSHASVLSKTPSSQNTPAYLIIPRTSRHSHVGHPGRVAYNRAKESETLYECFIAWSTCVNPSSWSMLASSNHSGMSDVRPP